MTEKESVAVTTAKEFLDRKETTDMLTELEATFRNGGHMREADGIHRAEREIERMPETTTVFIGTTSLQHIGSSWSHTWLCTNCNEIAYYPPHGNRKKRMLQPCGYKFCPNCGAKVEEVTL